MMDLRALFRGEFSLHWVTLAPAAAILLLSVLRVNVKIAMTASILISAALCVFLQNLAPLDLLKISLVGFHTPDVQIGPMMNGGGAVSMLNVAGIVCLSSSYSGVFQKTGLLDSLKRSVERIAKGTTPDAAILSASIAARIISCNQTLAIMLTEQLCRDLDMDRSGLANALEDTAVVIPSLVPWSIAGGVPLASVGAPASSVLFACYLYLLPLWRLACSFFKPRFSQRKK